MFFPEPIFFHLLIGESCQPLVLCSLNFLFISYLWSALKELLKRVLSVTCSNCQIHFLPYESFSHFFTPWKLLISLQLLTLKRTKDHLLVNLIGIPQSLYFLTSCQQRTQLTTLWFVEHLSLDSIHFLLSFHPSILSRLFFLILLPYQKQIGLLKLLLITSVTSNFYALKHSEEIKTLIYELYTLPGKYPHCST